MKHFHSIILAGLMVHFLPISAENSFIEEALPSALSALGSESDTTSLSPLDEELARLDQEFEEFDQELSSLPEMSENLQATALVETEVSPILELHEEPFVAIEEELVAPENLGILESDPIAIETFETQVAIDLKAEADALPIINDYAPAVEKEADILPLSALETEVDSKQTAWSEEEFQQQATFNIPKVTSNEKTSGSQSISVDLQQAFSGAPVIYSLLLAMSVFSVFIWLYSVYSMRSSTRISTTFVKNVQNKLNSNHFDDVLSLCEEKKGVFCKMLSSGIHSRRHGLPVMIEAMKAEGKRSTTSFWQKIGLLNDIAIIAPMLGLLGTVLGMFYAFYDVNRSMESISTLFDGLGVSVGTTVAGIIVAILALILHSTAKYRLVTALYQVENEAQSLAVLIDDRTSIHKG